MKDLANLEEGLVLNIPLPPLLLVSVMPTGIQATNTLRYMEVHQ